MRHFKNSEGLLLLTEDAVFLDDGKVVKRIEVKSGSFKELEEIFYIEMKIMEMMEEFPIPVN